MAPADAGLRLAAHARRLLADYEDALHDVTGDARAPVGMLRISAPLMFGRLHVAPVVAEFLARHAGVNVELSLSNRMLDLIEHGIDVALRIGELNDSQLFARKLGQVRRIVVASPAYLARHGTPSAPAELHAHALILQSTDGQAAEWRFPVAQTGAQAGMQAGVQAGGYKAGARGRLLVNQAETAIDLACAGTGLIRPLSYQVAAQLASGALVRVMRDFEPPALPVNLVYCGKHHMALRIRTFLDFATAALLASAAHWSCTHEGAGHAPG